MPNTRPSSCNEYQHVASTPHTFIQFDENGICSACHFNEAKEDGKIDWKERERELLDLLDRYRNKEGSSYDVLVPGSGGKDSAYASHILKYKYDMNPLTVTWSPHLYTDVGWRNMQNWIHRGGFDNILFTPNGRVHGLLTRLAFENLVHPFQPFIIGQKHVGPKTALTHKIPLIFYGENPAEYGNNIKDNDVPTMDEKFFAQDVTLDTLYLGGVKATDLVKNCNISINDLNPYLPAPAKSVS